MTFAHALITGAAGVIGTALCHALRARSPSLRLSLVDRDEQGLARLVTALGGDARAFIWDLEKIDELPARWQALIDARGDVDLLVNNAGFMEMRSLVGTPWELGARLLAVDMLAPLRLMSLAAPSLSAHARGAIVNVASMAGVTPLRGCAYYGAAKAGLAMASEVAHSELAATGVHVVTVYPGPVRSPLEARARGQVPDSWLKRLLPTGDAEPLAQLIVAALTHRRARVVYPAFYDVAARIAPLASRFTRRFSPRPLA